MPPQLATRLQPTKSSSLHRVRLRLLRPSRSHDRLGLRHAQSETRWQECVFNTTQTVLPVDSSSERSAPGVTWDINTALPQLTRIAISVPRCSTDSIWPSNTFR